MPEQKNTPQNDPTSATPDDAGREAQQPGATGSTGEGSDTGRPVSAGRRNSMEPEQERDFADGPVEDGAHSGRSQSVHIYEPRKKNRAS